MSRSNSMRRDTVKSPDAIGHNGTPWTIVGTFADYALAEKRANDFRANGTNEVKIKLLAAGFSVRTRQTARTVAAIAKNDVVLHEETIETVSAKKSRVKAKDRRAREKNTESSNDDEA